MQSFPLRLQPVVMEHSVPFAGLRIAPTHNTPWQRGGGGWDGAQGGKWSMKVISLVV